jgi:hypothetical protein
LVKDQVRRRAERAEEEPDIIYFSDIIPTQVFRQLSKEPNTKLRFKIVVEAEQVLHVGVEDMD